MSESRHSSARDPRGSRFGLWAERVCWLLAVALIVPQMAAMAARATVAAEVNQESWSPSRREAYARLADRGIVPAPVGALRLRKRDGLIPVFSGTDESALTLGAGHLPETGALDGAGNIAIAGHRDGFFRALRHLRVGDRLTLSARAGERIFEITDMRVVAPDAVWVLKPTATTTLTLITCHPFYFVGHAPDRYVVRARLVEDARGSTAETAGSKVLTAR